MKEISIDSKSSEVQERYLVPSNTNAVTWPSVLPRSAANLLERMFRDPRVLEANECREIITQLKSAVELEPKVPELRVLLGMALCVDLQPQEAMEQLRQATHQAPDCFIARLKYGELLMRLRVCDQAAEQTKIAAQLALNAYQSDLARKQAATIRTMMREGIERGGYTSFLSRLMPFRRKSVQSETAPLVIAS